MNHGQELEGGPILVREVAHNGPPHIRGPCSASIEDSMYLWEVWVDLGGCMEEQRWEFVQLRWILALHGHKGQERKEHQKGMD